METKQKTLSLLLALALGAGSKALAEPVPTLDVRPVLTQVPISAATPVPTERPCPTQIPQKPSVPTAAPDWCPPATAVPPAYIPESTAAPQPTAAATPVPTPAPTAVQTPEATKKPVVATPAPSTDDDYTTGYVGMQEEIAFLLLNQDRAANGLAPLTLDPVLCSIARAKSQDMKDNRYFAHNSPTWGSASQMLKTFGYSFSAVGENIAHHATVEKSQAAFMSSPGHRRNILSSSWRKVGIGVVTDAQGFVYVTQLFVR
jgi:uncharacterized protein YkwD